MLLFAGAALAQTCSQTTVYRYRNTQILGHFYTTSMADGAARIAAGEPLVLEGAAFNACSSGSTANGVYPVERFKHLRVPGVYFYTMLPQEMASVRASLSDILQDQGVAFYALNFRPSASYPVYRFRNTAVAGANFYTILPDEEANIIANVPGYALEGTGFWAMPPGSAPQTPLAIETLTLPDATAGSFYLQPAATASGGSPPYHYQLDTLVNGAPPIGMSIDLNGNLTGTPSSSYTAPLTFTFGVCVVDIGGASDCSQATVTVVPVATGSVTWTIGDQCNNGHELDYRFFDTANNMQWPAGTLEYYMFYGNTYQSTLSCVAGALVCYGASSNAGSLTWGIGLSGTGSCTSCCGRCDGSSYSVNLTCPGTGGGGGGTSYYANWTCGSSSQCASVMGGSAGTRGPFCALADCQRWGNQFIPAGYSCSTNAIYSPIPGGSSCYSYP
jgi:hypothetical protein